MHRSTEIKKSSRSGEGHAAEHVAFLFLLHVMATASVRHSTAVWHQALVLVLALGVGLQGVPVESLLHAVDSSCVCAEQNYCPRNPDGDCACPHHSHEHGHDEDAASSESTAAPTEGDRLVLRSCDTAGPDARVGVATAKWLVPRVERALSPPVVERTRAAAEEAWAPQRIGDDIFHPPWPRSA
jgi:hypothetical protein